MTDYIEEIKAELGKAVDICIALGRVVRAGSSDDCPFGLEEINGRIDTHLTTPLNLLSGDNETPTD